MSKSLKTTSRAYAELLHDLRERIRAAQIRASLSVNKELVLLYWTIGRDILTRQAAEGWGSKVIERLATDLRKEFPGIKGFSTRNLLFMRGFAEAFSDASIVKQLVSQIPWGHIIRIIQMLKKPAEREWYIRQILQNGWSRDVLVHHIESNLYRRQGKAITNFARTLPQPQSDLAHQVLKDPYSFDFLTLDKPLVNKIVEECLCKPEVRDQGFWRAMVNSNAEAYITRTSRSWNFMRPKRTRCRLLSCCTCRLRGVNWTSLTSMINTWPG